MVRRRWLGQTESLGLNCLSWLPISRAAALGLALATSFCTHGSERLHLRPETQHTCRAGRSGTIATLRRLLLVSGADNTTLILGMHSYNALLLLSETTLVLCRRLESLLLTPHAQFPSLGRRLCSLKPGQTRLGFEQQSP